MSRPTTCGGCSVVWHQAGNRTGHCSQCHRTFSGITAFDAHQSTRDGRVICADPAALLDRDHAPRFAYVYDVFGAVVWRSADTLPKGTFQRKAP